MDLPSHPLHDSPGLPRFLVSSSAPAMEFRVAPLPRILRVCRFASSRFRESCFNGRSDDESRFLELCILWREPADESSCQPVRALSGLTLDARSISLGPSLPEIPFANCRLQLVCASSCQVRAFKSDSLQGHQLIRSLGLFILWKQVQKVH